MNTLKKMVLVAGAVPSLALSAVRYWSMSMQLRFVKFVAGSFER